MTRVACVAVFMLLTFSGAAWGAERIAVVDVERVFRESAPGKAGEAHFEQAREILQKGMDELRALYQGSESSPEGEAALREGRAALERQLAAERQAVRQVLTEALQRAITSWFDAAGGRRQSISAVAPASAFFIHSPAIDVTSAVILEMNKEQPVFHALPTVTIRANQPPPVQPDTAQQPEAPAPQQAEVSAPAPQQAEAPAQQPKVSAPAPPSGASALQQGEIRHVVQSGDTLRKLGARYNVSPEAIMRRNKLPSPNHIVMGTTLIIPTPRR